MLNVQRFYRALTIAALYVYATHISQNQGDLEIKLITLRFSSAKF